MASVISLTRSLGWLFLVALQLQAVAATRFGLGLSSQAGACCCRPLKELEKECHSNSKKGSTERYQLVKSPTGRYCCKSKSSCQKLSGYSTGIDSVFTELGLEAGFRGFNSTTCEPNKDAFAYAFKEAERFGMDGVRHLNEGDEKFAIEMAVKMNENFPIESNPLNQIDEDGMSYMHRAVYKSLPKLACSLVALPRFTQINAVTASREKQSALATGMTVLHLAAQKGLSDVVNCILMFANSELVNRKTSTGETALHKAARSGTMESCEAIFTDKKFKHSDLIAVNLQGRTAFGIFKYEYEKKNILLNGDNGGRPWAAMEADGGNLWTQFINDWAKMQQDEERASADAGRAVLNMDPNRTVTWQDF